MTRARLPARDALTTFKDYGRNLTVKSLSEREVPADTVIWPMNSTDTNNDLGIL